MILENKALVYVTHWQEGIEGRQSSKMRPRKQCIYLVYCLCFSTATQEPKYLDIVIKAIKWDIANPHFFFCAQQHRFIINLNCIFNYQDFFNFFFFLIEKRRDVGRPGKSMLIFGRKKVKRRVCVVNLEHTIKTPKIN